jgi:lysophospholipase L1-like esterase
MQLIITGGREYCWYDEAVKAFFTSKPGIFLAVILALIVIVGLANVLIIKFRGTAIPAPVIPRAAEKYGENNSRSLTYAVLGDSTTIAQGGDYDQGYARATTRYIASRGYAVTFYNFGISGATAGSVVDTQLKPAVAVHPDVVLIVAGANDVTRLTSFGSVEKSLARSIDTLRADNPAVRVIVTGSPQMGSVPRFPEPTRYLAGLRTNGLNTAVQRMAAEKSVVFAPIAEKTGPIFDEHPEYFAADKFHPTTQGYSVWTPVLETALGQIL